MVKGRVLAGASELGRTRAWLGGSGVGSEAGAAGEDCVLDRSRWPPWAGESSTESPVPTRGSRPARR